MSRQHVQYQKELLQGQRVLAQLKLSIETRTRHLDTKEKDLETRENTLKDAEDLFQQRLERLKNMEDDLVKRSAQLRQAERQIWKKETQIIQRQLRTEQCCVELEKERTRLDNLQRTLRQQFPLTQKRGQELRQMERAFLTLLDRRARQDEKRREDAQKKHAQFVKKRQQDLAARQGVIRGREQTLRRSQQTFRTDLSKLKHHILTNDQFARRLDEYNTNRLLFTGVFDTSTTVPSESTFESLFWTLGRHQSDTLFLFHGTDSVSRRSLQTQGPKTDRARRIAFGQGFYLTPDPLEALRYAETRFRQRKPSTRCMSPILLVYEIKKDDARTWRYFHDFSINVNRSYQFPPRPYYVIVKNQDKIKELTHVATLFLEEKC